jgi:hypothetical protein
MCVHALLKVQEFLKMGIMVEASSRVTYFTYKNYLRLDGVWIVEYVIPASPEFNSRCANLNAFKRNVWLYVWFVYKRKELC